MMTEHELQQKLAKAQRQSDALVFLNTLGIEHKDSCASQDDTGHPAPCTCGAEPKVNIVRYLKNLVLEDD
jgi:hypothetical protein